MLIKNILRKAFLLSSKFACKYFPYLLGPSLAELEYRRITGARLNLNSPKNLIEKIIWMQFHTDTTLWTKCADKYLVRSFVEEKGLDFLLPKLYGKWNNADDIKFDSLPQKFVLKTNNSCGQNIIVREKKELNVCDTKKKLNRWLKIKYGYHNAQLHYLRINPCIIAEELLEDQSLKHGESLIDYKIWCFNGVPESILVVSNRSGAKYNLNFYDLNWNDISETALKHSTSHFNSNVIAKPDNLQKMIEYASILSKGFPQVRVDFYNINGKIYFGELTFTSGYGNYSDEYYNHLGKKIEIEDLKKIR